MSAVCSSCAQAAHCLLLSPRDKAVYSCLYCRGTFLYIPLPSRAAFYTMPVSNACPLAVRDSRRLTFTPYVCQAAECQEKMRKYYAAAMRVPV